MFIALNWIQEKLILLVTGCGGGAQLCANYLWFCCPYSLKVYTNFQSTCEVNNSNRDIRLGVEMKMNHIIEISLFNGGVGIKKFNFFLDFKLVVISALTQNLN